MRSPLPILSFSLTTTGTVTPISPLIDSGSGLRANYWLDLTAIGSGSGWGATFKWVSPSGNSLTLGTSAAITGTSLTTNSQLVSWTTALAAATAMANPPCNAITFNASTAGTTTSISGVLYLIPSD